MRLSRWPAEINAAGREQPLRVLASAGILISHSCTVANFRYKTSVAWTLQGWHPQAVAHQSAQRQVHVLHKPDGLSGFALEESGHPMTLTQAPSQAKLQLCLQEET